MQQHQQQRDLLSSWCPSSTPVLWHRDLTKTWSAGACICDTYVTSTYLIHLLFAKLKHSICDSNERALSRQQPCPIRYFTGCLQPAWYYASNVWIPIILVCSIHLRLLIRVTWHVLFSLLSANRILQLINLEIALAKCSDLPTVQLSTSWTVNIWYPAWYHTRAYWQNRNSLGAQQHE
jgi:hypothetical protein